MKEVILIVDDQEEHIINFSDHISELQTGYTVVPEQNFSNAIKKIEEICSNGDKVVAAFVDLCDASTQHPFDDRGKNIISAIKEKYSDILIVAYTQYGNEYINEALDAGANWAVKKQEVKELTLKKLKTKIEEHMKITSPEGKQKKDWNVNILLKILEKISETIKSITNKSHRYSNRNNIFRITDEYDFQDLTWAILKPIFKRMTKEISIPKHLGKTSRADFYIPEIRTIIEIKHVKTESSAREIPKQLDNDISWYGEFNDAEKLIFYVYLSIDCSFDFEPMINELNRDNYLRNGKKWDFVKCIVGRGY